MNEYDFAGLTQAAKSLLTFAGWRVEDASSRKQPHKKTAQVLIDRGLLVVSKRSDGWFYVLEYTVPPSVHIAWCEWCSRKRKRK